MVVVLVAMPALGLAGQGAGHVLLQSYCRCPPPQLLLLLLLWLRLGRLMTPLQTVPTCPLAARTLLQAARICLLVARTMTQLQR